MTFDIINSHYEVDGDKLQVNPISLEFQRCDKKQIEDKLGNAQLDIHPELIE